MFSDVDIVASAEVAMLQRAYVSAVDHFWYVFPLPPCCCRVILDTSRDTNALLVGLHLYIAWSSNVGSSMHHSHSRGPWKSCILPISCCAWSLHDYAMHNDLMLFVVYRLWLQYELYRSKTGHPRSCRVGKCILVRFSIPRWCCRLWYLRRLRCAGGGRGSFPALLEASQAWRVSYSTAPRLNAIAKMYTVGSKQVEMSSSSVKLRNVTVKVFSLGWARDLPFRYGNVTCARKPPLLRKSTMSYCQVLITKAIWFIPWYLPSIEDICDTFQVCLSVHIMMIFGPQCVRLLRLKIPSAWPWNLHHAWKMSQSIALPP